MPLGKSLVRKWGKYYDKTSGEPGMERMRSALTIFRLASVDGAPVAIPGFGGTLYMGSIGTAYSTDELREAGITHVVCATDAARINPLFTTLRVSVADREDARGEMNAVVSTVRAFIDYARAQGGRVLVHCFQGVSRATTLVVAYMLLNGNHTSVAACLAAVRTVRPRAAPNTGFIAVLHELESRVAGNSHPGVDTL